MMEGRRKEWREGSRKEERREGRATQFKWALPWEPPGFPAPKPRVSSVLASFTHVLPHLCSWGPGRCVLSLAAPSPFQGVNTKD